MGSFQSHKDIPLSLYTINTTVELNMKCNLSKYDIDNDILLTKWYDQRHDSHVSTLIFIHIFDSIPSQLCDKLTILSKK